MHRAKSTDLAALARLLAIGGGNLAQASVIAESTRAPESVRMVLKAAVDAGTSSDADWARPLSEYADVIAAFVEALRSRSAFARILADGAVRLPLKTRAAIVTADASAWVIGEGLPVPVSGMALAGAALEARQAASLVVVTAELIRSTSPAARALIDASLRAAVSDAIDASFLGLIADGITPLPASGSTATDALADLRTMLDTVNVAGSGALFWIASASVANAAATLASASGDLVFPGASPVGGELLGLPMLVSSAVLSGTLLLVDAGGIAAELESISLSLSDQASLQMDTTPTNPPVAATVFVSLWQTNRIGLLARCYFGAERLRDSAIAILSDVAWEAAP